MDVTVVNCTEGAAGNGILNVTFASVVTLAAVGVTEIKPLWRYPILLSRLTTVPYR